jgi:DNA polymerase III subunit epsilon
MKLNLKNPLIVFDLEATGPDIVKDRIVEICYLKIFPNGNEESKTIRVNPTIPISPKAIEIHGITDEDVKNEPTFQELAKNIAKEFEGADLAGYNSNKFDIPLLMEEFLRAEVDFDMKKRKWIDVQVIFFKMEQRTLRAAYKFYCQKELKNAHSATADTKATYEVLQAQLDRYQDKEFEAHDGSISKPIINDMKALAAFSSHTKNVDFAGRIVLNDKNTKVFNFGKYKGKPVEEVLDKDPAYYGWIMNSDFPLYTKKVLTNIKLQKFGK